MARRKTRRTRTTRRRRVSGLGSNDLKVIVGVVLGAVGASLANTQVAKMPKPIDPKIVAAVEVLGGGFMATKSRSPLMKGVGFGVAATGANTAARSFGFVSGFRSLGPINGMRRVSGLSDGKFISGPGNKRMGGSNAASFVSPGKFPAAHVISGMVNVNGHGSGNAM